MKILAVDYGRRRIGLAAAVDVAVALPRGCIEGGEDAAERLAALVRAEGFERVVVGDPITLRGERGPMAVEVDAFVSRLEPLINVPVERVDERNSSNRARDAMRTRPKKKREEQRRDGTLDSMAATLILGCWLESNA